MRYEDFEDKELFRSPRIKWWGIHLFHGGMHVPTKDRLSQEEAIRVAIAWDMPYSFKQIRQKAINNDTLLERLYTRSLSLDWLTRVIGGEGVKNTYQKYKHIARPDLTAEIERLLLQDPDKSLERT